MPRKARRLEGLVQSDIRRMTRECERVGGINLGQGICDLVTPPLVRDGAIEAIRSGKSTYSFAEGIEPLRRAIAVKLERDNGIRANPMSEIVVTAGSSGAYASALFALLDPGDGIVLFEPYYGYHLNTALVAGLVPQFVTLPAPEFRLVEANLRAAIRPNTRAIVVCSPSNPCGRMFDVEELKILERVAREHDLWVFTDEIYEYIRYDGREHISPATIGSLYERTVTIMGLSKTFSITGWRLGYAVAREDVARQIALVHDLFFICAPTPLQHGVAAGFSAPKSYFEGLQAEFTKKREWTCDALYDAGLDPIEPEGAYYVLADVSKMGFDTSRQAALAILERTGVATVPGSSFYQGSEGERFVRVCYAKEDDVLQYACKRLAQLGE
ncbi:MAG: pyridoxal phosphate-dependent aminotransferase [Planctomycetota bacterium]|nr:pyridoxal phosphate-dependent aminotransferase [Planctomycetota bacterium]